jgi:hypothetical protein
VQETGCGWTALCPAHADTRPSLSIAQGEDGRALVKCHVGCDINAIVAAVGLTLKDLFPETNGGAKRRGEPWVKVAEYPYRDEQGTLLFKKIRWRVPEDGSKRYSYVQPDGKKSIKGVRRVPYQLDRVVKLSPESGIVIAEGEKCCDALRRISILATTNPNGASKDGKCKWDELDSEAVTKAFTGREIIILPDNDEAGWRHARGVARNLLRIAQRVTLVSIPDLPKKGDIADWIEEREKAGRTKAEIKRELMSLIETAPALSEPPEEKFDVEGSPHDQPPHDPEREGCEHVSGICQTLPYGPLCQALIAIAQACDGAQARDGMGFNRDDRERGHLLVNKAKRGELWSVVEAKDAFRMAKYYGKQLRKLGINSELLTDPAVEEGEKAIMAIEAEAEKDPRSAIRKALDNSETIENLAALRASERERFEAAKLRLRDHGVKASEIDSFQQAVKAKNARKARRESGGDTAGTDQEDKYETTDGGIVWMKQTSDGEVSVKLTNFCTWIRAQVVMDNGAETSISLELEVSLRQRTFKVTVRAEEFASLSWVIQNLGPEAIVYPGVSIRDRARAAIQILSTGIVTRHIYTHCGWRRIEGRWVFLHAAGAIGSIGPEQGIEVSLDEGLGEIVLPAPPGGEELATAIQATRRLLTLGPPRIVFVAFCAVWRSVLGEALAVDFALHFAGRTGVFKTEFAALLQPGLFIRGWRRNEKTVSGALFPRQMVSSHS